MMRLGPISCRLALLPLLFAASAYPQRTWAQHVQNVSILRGVHSPRPSRALHPKPKQTISSMEQQWRDSMLSGDPTQLEKLLAEDYVGISWNGQVNTKTSQLNRLRNKQIQLSQLDLSDTKVKMVGTAVAIVTSQAAMAGLIDGSDVHGNFRYTRVYQEDPHGSWKVTNFEATRIRKHGKEDPKDAFPLVPPPAPSPNMTAPPLEPVPAAPTSPAPAESPHA